MVKILYGDKLFRFIPETRARMTESHSFYTNTHIVSNVHRVIAENPMKDICSWLS